MVGLARSFNTTFPDRLQRYRWIISFISGAVLPSTMAPLYWWPLAIPSLALLFFLLQNIQPRPRPIKQVFATLWWFSFGQFLVGVSWVYVSMTEYGGTPIWMAIPMVALFCGFLALIPAITVAVWLSLTKLTPLLFACGWFIAEWLRSWILTGFPWLFIGDGHIDSPLSGWAAIIGSYGIGLLVVLFSAQIMLTLQRRWRQDWIICAAIIGIALAGIPLQQIQWTQPQQQISVAALQGNIDQNTKWLPETMLPTIDWYHAETEKLLGTDLILWPETAITMLEYDYRLFRSDLDGLALDQGSNIITGIPYQHGLGSAQIGDFHNSILAFGAGNGLYHKQRLVPFGEYVPLADLIRGWIPFFDIPVHGFKPGKDQQPPLTLRLNQNESKSTQFAQVMPYICYEIAYPTLVSRTAKMADLLVTVSNDAWFGDSLGPKQHLGLVQMRALETQRWILRSTNTGITALVDHNGMITAQLEPSKAGYMTANAELRQGSTPYMLWQHYPLLTLSFACLFFIIMSKRLSNNPLNFLRGSHRG